MRPEGSLVPQVTPLSGNCHRRANRSRTEPQRLVSLKEWVSVAGTNEERAARLARAIVATVTGDTAQLQDLFTLDVLASGPNLQATSRDQLAAEIERRVSAFSDRKVAVAPLDVSGAQACVEWVASGVHSGDYASDSSGRGPIGPTGRRIRLRAITVAEFEGDQICSLRSYWDDVTLLEHLGVLDGD
jgi:ketosteroid isomerase-like protein